MAAIKVGVREFREKISTFLESDTPVAVTRRGETLGVYVPTRRKHTKTADTVRTQGRGGPSVRKRWRMSMKKSW